jgi:hypothetical protein
MTEPTEPRVCIGNVTDGTWRIETAMSVIATLASSKRWAGNIDVISRPGLYVCDNRNNVVHDYLHMFPEDKYLLMLDSDIAFEPDDITTLVNLAEDLAPCVISGAYPTARYGKAWVVAGREVPDVTDWEPSMAARPGVRPFTMEEFHDLADGAEEAIPVDACGAGFMLIPRAILEHMRATYPPPFPWFHEPVEEGLVAGDDNGMVTHEDFGFCERVKELGYPVLLHPGVRLKHVKTIALET